MLSMEGWISPKIMIFNSSRSIESICGLEVTQEQLDEYDQEDKKLFEAEV